MQLLLKSTSWTTKPSPGTELDSLNPLCPDHCWPFLSPMGSALSLARRRKLSKPPQGIYTGSSSIVPGRKYGLSLRHGAVTDITQFTVDAAEADAVVGFSGGFTQLICVRKTDTTNRASTAIGVTGALTGTDATQFLAPYSDGSVYWDYGGGVTGTSRLIVAGLTFGDDLWITSTGPRGMDIWQNGILRASQSGFANRTTANFYYGTPAGTPNFSDLSDIGLVMTWKRQLTTQEIISMSINPWQVFKGYYSVSGALAISAAAGKSSVFFE